MSVPQLQDKHPTKLIIDLTVSVIHTVSHLTSYCISSVVTYQLNQSLADHDCIAYSNTVEIFFAQQDQLQTVKS